MQITKIAALDLEQKMRAIRLWNKEYPKELNYKTLQDFEVYLNKLQDTHHYLLIGEENILIGWAFSFMRDAERWFGIIIDSSWHGKGYGKQLMNTLKKDATSLNGWVMNHNNALKQDDTYYKSPLEFYQRIGFTVLPDVQLNIGELSMVKVVWNRT